ncbi:MAG: heavy metal-associated domain-containing protein [Candidatus Diapherotrites archaeon]
MEKVFKVKGMHCSSCSLLIEDVVSEVSGVERVFADYKSGLVKVVFSGDVVDKVKSAIEKEGYEVLE